MSGQTLREHTETEGLRIDSLCEVIDEMQKDIKEIKENHLAHLTAEQARVSANVEWLIKSYWVVVTAAVGSLISTLAGLILKG